MNFQEVLNTIRQKNYLFEVMVNGKSFNRHSLEQVVTMHGSLENYFNQIAKANNVKNIAIQLFAKNGSSFLKKGFFLVDIPAVVDSSTNVDYSTKNVDTFNKSLSGISTNEIPFENKNTFEIPSKMNATKADIENVRLATENKYLTEKVDELKDKTKELQRKNDEYYNENLKLQRELFTAKDKYELDYKQKMLDAETKKKQGLSGLLDEVKTLPPEAWTFIAGCLPNHPMAKGLPGQSTTTQEQSQLNGTKNPDADAQACIDVMVELLAKSSPEICGMMAMLTEKFVLNPATLKAVYDKFFPSNNTTNTNTQTPSN